MNKLIEMETFVQIVSAGSLVGAARRLRRNPSSVSKIIAGLEDRLSVRLLTRTTRNLVLTDAGESFYKHCKSILIDIEEAEETAMTRHENPRGRLRIIGMNALSPNTVLPLAYRFIERYPEIKLELVQAEFFPDMVGAEMDVAIRFGEVTSKGLECVRIAPSRRVICASPAYLERHGTPDTLASLTEHNCIVFSNLQHLNIWELNHNKHVETCHPSGNLVASNAELIRQAALSGRGICQLSDFIVGDDIREGRLIVLFPKQLETITNYVCAIYPRKERPPRKTLVFIEYLQENLSKNYH